MKKLFIRSRERKVTGLSFEGDRCRGVTVERRGAEVVVLERSESSLERIAYQFLSTDSKEKLVATAVRSDLILMRYLELPLKARRAVLQTLPFQCEDLLPYPQDEAIVLANVLVKGEMSEVALFSLLKTDLRDHLDLLGRHYIYPDYVGCEPQALYRYARHFFPSEERLFLLYGQEERALVVEMSGKIVVRSITLNFKGEEGLLKEMRRLFFFFEDKKIADAPWVVIEQGECAERFLKEHGQQCLKSEPAAEMAPWAIAFGAALDAAHDDEMSLQFAKEVFAPKHHVRACREKMGTLFKQTAILGLLLACGLFGYARYRADGLDRQLKATFGQYGDDFPALRDVAQGPLSFAQKLEKGRQIVLQEKKKNVNTQTPCLVSDLLAYLSTHPQLQKESGIQIERLHYEVVTYPTIEKSQIPYLVRVDLMISAQNPEKASQFYEALRKGDRLVDPKKEIKWNRHEEGYNVSFFLKPAL